MNNSGPLPPFRPLREAAGLSQRAVERALGWNTGRLSTIERGLIPTEAERTALVAYLVGHVNAQIAKEEPS